MKALSLTACLLLAGCGAPLEVTVYGRSGAAFRAPSLCGALIACMNSTETACYYDRTLYRDTNGKTLEESGCKEVGK